MIYKTAGQSRTTPLLIDGNLLQPVIDALGVDRDDILEMHFDPRMVTAVIVTRSAEGLKQLIHTDACNGGGAPWCCDSRIATQEVWSYISWNP